MVSKTLSQAQTTYKKYGKQLCKFKKIVELHLYYKTVEIYIFRV
jgi:hypothetical protein